VWQLKFNPALTGQEINRALCRERMFKTLRVFAPSSSEFIPFLTCHHSITDFEINAFLNQDSYSLLKFVSDLVSIFDSG